MKNWEFLKNAYKNGIFPDAVRAQLLDDALFLGRNGLLNHEFSLDMMNLMLKRGEKQYIVWRPVFRHLKYLRGMMKEIDETKMKSRETSIRFKVSVGNYSTHCIPIKILYYSSFLEICSRVGLPSVRTSAFEIRRKKTDPQR